MKHSFIDVSFQLEQYPMDTGLAHPKINFRASRETTQPNRKQRIWPWLHCFLFVPRLSISPSFFQPVCAPGRCSFLKHCRLSLSDAQRSAEWRGTHEEGPGDCGYGVQPHTHKNCHHRIIKTLNPFHLDFFAFQTKAPLQNKGSNTLLKPPTITNNTMNTCLYMGLNC